MSNNFKILKDVILTLSENKEHWELAFAEWSLANVYQEKGGTCICTHNPITDHCVIKNHVNGRETTVGNCCIQRFMDHIDTNGLFYGLARIANDLDAWPSEKLLKFARQKGVIGLLDFTWADYLRTKRMRQDGSWFFPMSETHRKERRRAINVAILNMTHPGHGDRLYAALKEREFRQMLYKQWNSDASPFAQLASEGL